MSRSLILAIALASGTAYADVESIAQTDEQTDERQPGDVLSKQGIGAQVGVAGGGGVTPGGLQIGGHYLYQLSEQDWFDGTASFTFGGGASGCVRDGMDLVSCDHGFTDGNSFEITAAVRRYFAAQGKYTPFARAGVGIAVVRYGADDITGVTIPLHGGGGVRAVVAKDVAIVAQAELVLGIGRFNRSLGMEPQLGIAVTAGAEFRLP